MARPPQEQNSTSPKKEARVIQSVAKPPPLLLFRSPCLALVVRRSARHNVSAAALPKHWQKIVLGLLAIAFACGSMALLFGVWCRVCECVCLFFLGSCARFYAALLVFFLGIFLSFSCIFICISSIFFVSLYCSVRSSFTSFCRCFYAFLCFSFWLSRSSRSVGFFAFGLVGWSWLFVGCVPFVGAVGVGVCGGVFVLVVWRGAVVFVAGCAVCRAVLRCASRGFGVVGLCSCGVAFGCGCACWRCACSCGLVGRVVGGSSSWCGFSFFFVGGALWLLLLSLPFLLVVLVCPRRWSLLWRGRVLWRFRVRARLCRLCWLRCWRWSRLVRLWRWAARRAWTRRCGLRLLAARCFRLLRLLRRRGRVAWCCARRLLCGLGRGVLLRWWLCFRLVRVLVGFRRRPLFRRVSRGLGRVRGLLRRLLRVWVRLCWCSRLWVFLRGVFLRWVLVGGCFLLRRRCFRCSPSFFGGGLLIAWGTPLAPASLVAPPRGAKSANPRRAVRSPLGSGKI